MRNLNWSDFKSYVDNKSLTVQYFSSNNQYEITAFDGPQKMCCLLSNKQPATVGSDQEDFELNYLPSANGKLQDEDINGRKVTRVAASNKGTSYRAHFFDFSTCTLDSLICEDWEGNNDMDIGMKFYDVNNVELTTQASIDTSCVKSIVTFKPMYDYELVSGTVNVQSSPSEDMRLWVVGGVPELGAAGVREFVRNLNIKYISPSETLQTDGRASKYMKKTTMGVPFNTNQLQIIIKCNTSGVKHPIMMAFEYFRV